MAIGNTDAAGREATCQSTLGSPPPVDPSPLCSDQQLFGGDGRLIRDGVFARSPGLRDREDQTDIGGIDVLTTRQPYRPFETALAQNLTESPAGAVSGIGEDAAENARRRR